MNCAQNQHTSFLLIILQPELNTRPHPCIVGREGAVRHVPGDRAESHRFGCGSCREARWSLHGMYSPSLSQRPHFLDAFPILLFFFCLFRLILLYSACSHILSLSLGISSLPRFLYLLYWMSLNWYQSPPLSPKPRHPDILFSMFTVTTHVPCLECSNGLTGLSLFIHSWCSLIHSLHWKWNGFFQNVNQRPHLKILR